jgi:hypothetical protein
VLPTEDEGCVLVTCWGVEEAEEEELLPLEPQPVAASAQSAIGRRKRRLVIVRLLA